MQSFLIGGLAGGFFVFFGGIGVAGIFFGGGLGLGFLGFLGFLEILDFLEFLDFLDFLEILEILAPSHKKDWGVHVCTPPSWGGFSLGRFFWRILFLDFCENFFLL